MIVRIKKCSDPSFWYAGHVGERFDIVAQDPTEWVVIEPSGYLNIIKKEDTYA